MSRIDDLIAEYCPNGVERKPLGAIAKLYRGNGLQKKDFTDKGIGCIHYGQIYTRYDTFTSQTISFVDKKLADKLLKVHPNDLIVTATSENLEDVCKAVAWLGGSDIVTGGHSIVVRHHQNAKYLSYYFQTLDFFQRKRAYVHGTKVMEIKKDDLAKIVVPVPPLPVQEEFNRIVSEEHLKTGIAEQFIIDCFKEGYVDTDGTRIVSMLPPCVTLRAEQRVRADEESSRRTVPPILRSLRRNVMKRSLLVAEETRAPGTNLVVGDAAEISAASPIFI